MLNPNLGREQFDLERFDVSFSAWVEDRKRMIDELYTLLFFPICYGSGDFDLLS